MFIIADLVTLRKKMRKTMCLFPYIFGTYVLGDWKDRPIVTFLCSTHNVSAGTKS